MTFVWLSIVILLTVTLLAVSKVARDRRKELEAAEARVDSMIAAIETFAEEAQS